MDKKGEDIFRQDLTNPHNFIFFGSRCFFPLDVYGQEKLELPLKEAKCKDTRKLVSSLIEATLKHT